MTEKDIIFKFYKAGEKADPDCFCHYGWEGEGAFAFWKYAQAYYNSAEILFDKFKESKGDYATLNGIGLTICFLYRHFVELSVKYLFVKFVAKDLIQYINYLEKGHNLKELWKATKPTLSKLRKRCGSSVSIGSLEHYIFEFDKFDQNEDAMRYPVKKDTSRMHDPSRLDIVVLHDRMLELYHAFEEITGDLENQLFDEVPEEKLELFKQKYEEMRFKIFSFISEMKKLSDIGTDTVKKNKCHSLNDILAAPDPKMEYLKKFTADELMMIDTLYYTGRMIKCQELRLPRNPHEAKMDVYKMCVINMMHDHLEFGTPINEEFNIWSKAENSIYSYVKEAVSVLEWDKLEILEQM